MDLPLRGVRVLDLTHRLAGPTLTMMLGDWGADVLKVEWWERMDAWRGMISVKHDTHGDQTYNKLPKWLKLNRNKRGITLNLKTEKGKQLFRGLARQSDVVADNFSAGVLDRLGLGYDALSEINPRIIVISMPGFGNDGPDARFVANGSTIEGYAGLASITGYAGESPRNTMGIWPDPVAGMHGAVAIGMALMRRESTGRGQYIELSQAETLVNMIGEAVLEYAANGTVAGPAGNSDPEMAPHGTYPGRGEDRWITIAVATDGEWTALCEVAGNPTWAGAGEFATAEGRRAHSETLDALIGDWTREHDIWELAERLQHAGVAAGPVVTMEDFNDRPDIPSRRFEQHLEGGYIDRYPGPAARLDGTEPAVRSPAPRLGEHTREVLSELLQLPAAELDRLEAEGVI